VSWLLDTDVVSELRKVRAGRADPNIAAWAEAQDAASLWLSVIAVQEIEIGILLRERSDPAQGAQLRAWLEDRVLPAFAGRILPVTLEVARRGAALHVPGPRPARDGLIAATALAHGLGVATRNVRDFDGTGVRLTNPWEDAEG
jgi:predicted nucleic acid-binding protein